METTIKRPDVLRVSDNPTVAAHDTIYSGRSSWDDVKSAGAHTPAEWLKLVSKNGGREQACKNAQVFDDHIACGAQLVFKRDIDRVYYVRLKPSSNKQVYLSHEGMASLEARTWFNHLLQGRIEVPLWESAAPEDNAAVSCKAAPKW